MVPLRKGSTTDGQCTVHRRAGPPQGVPGYDQRDPRRVADPRPTLRGRLPSGECSESGDDRVTQKPSCLENSGLWAATSSVSPHVEHYLLGAPPRARFGTPVFAQGCHLAEALHGRVPPACGAFRSRTFGENTPLAPPVGRGCAMVSALVFSG